MEDNLKNKDNLKNEGRGDWVCPKFLSQGFLVGFWCGKK